MSAQTPQPPETAAQSSPRPSDGDKKRRSPDAATTQSARKKARTPDTVPRRGRIIRLLVGGREHATTRDTLSMVPDSFLDRLVSGELPSTLDEQGRYFIDRNGELFVFVLDWLRTAGDAEVVARASPDVLGRLRIEADFYGIDDLAAACTANLERLAQKDKENRVRAAPPRRTSTTAPSMPAKEPSPPPPRPREPLDAALFAGPGDDDSDF
jgi:hypothetical protein